MTVVNAGPLAVVPALVKTLQATNRLLCSNSVVGLGAFGAKPKPAVPLLMKLLDDPEKRVRIGVTNALNEIAPEVVGPELGSVLRPQSN